MQDYDNEQLQLSAIEICGDKKLRVEDESKRVDHYKCCYPACPVTLACVGFPVCFVLRSLCRLLNDKSSFYPVNGPSVASRRWLRNRSFNDARQFRMMPWYRNENFLPPAPFIMKDGMHSAVRAVPWVVGRTAVPLRFRVNHYISPVSASCSTPRFDREIIAFALSTRTFPMAKTANGEKAYSPHATAVPANFSLILSPRIFCWISLPTCFFQSLPAQHFPNACSVKVTNQSMTTIALSTAMD